VLEIELTTTQLFIRSDFYTLVRGPRCFDITGTPDPKTVNSADPSVKIKNCPPAKSPSLNSNSWVPGTLDWVCCPL